VALTDIQAIRLKVADQPVFQREQWTADGVTSEIRLGVFPVLADPAPRIWKNSTLLVETTDYTIDYENGIVSFVTLPSAGDAIVLDYSAVVWTDEEIEYFLGEGAGSTTLATVYMLLAWAASAAKIAKKETLAGGGGLGMTTVDTAVRARELRETAKAYYSQWEKDEGGSVPFEVITEVAWTHMQAERMVVERYIRELT
jgi:hypothetical protein